VIGFVALSGALWLTWNLVARATHDSVLTSTEAANIAVTELFVNEAWQDVRVLLPAPDATLEVIKSNPDLKKIDERVRRFERGADIVKVKIFDLKGVRFTHLTHRNWAKTSQPMPAFSLQATASKPVR